MKKNFNIFLVSLLATVLLFRGNAPGETANEPTGSEKDTIQTEGVRVVGGVHVHVVGQHVDRQHFIFRSGEQISRGLNCVMNYTRGIRLSPSVSARR